MKKKLKKIEGLVDSSLAVAVAGDANDDGRWWNGTKRNAFDCSP